MFNRAMSLAMCSTAHEHMKIVWGVVELVAVNVVYDFTRSKAASKLFFHDGAVRVKSLSASASNDRPSCVNVFWLSPRATSELSCTLAYFVCIPSKQLRHVCHRLPVSP